MMKIRSKSNLRKKKLKTKNQIKIRYEKKKTKIEKSDQNQI